MPRRAAQVTQADIDRAIAAFRSTGVTDVAVEILPDGSVAVSPRAARAADGAPAASQIREWVYLIGYDDWVKIGFTSTSVERRLGGLQTGIPVKLTLIHSMPGSLALEAELHLRFAEYRAVGEWFRREGRLAAWIDAGCPR